MRSRGEREIARRLAERGEVEPPADLLARLQAEIPAEIEVARDLAPRSPRPPIGDPPARRGGLRARQGWLLAASLVAMIGAGLFSLRVRDGSRELAPPVADAAKARAAAPRAASERLPGKPPVPIAAPREPREETREMPSRSPALELQQQELQRQQPVSALPSADDREEAAAGSPGGPAGLSAGAAPEPASPPPAPRMEAERKEEADLAASPAAATAPAASPRAKAMNLEKRAPMAQTAGGFLDAATSPRDIVRPEAGRRPLVRDRADAASPVAGASGSVEAAASPAAEGGPTPLASDERRRLLLFRLSAVAGSGNVEVEINPSVVARYRRLRVSGSVLLYEVELQPAAGSLGASAVVAALHGGARLRVADLAPSWEQASPGFRLASLAAKLTELEAIPPDARPRGEIEELRGRVRTLAAELPGDPRAAELLARVERLSP